jgi:hypothetical protein
LLDVRYDSHSANLRQPKARVYVTQSMATLTPPLRLARIVGAPASIAYPSIVYHRDTPSLQHYSSHHPRRRRAHYHLHPL